MSRFGLVLIGALVADAAFAGSKRELEARLRATEAELARARAELATCQAGGSAHVGPSATEQAEAKAWLDEAGALADARDTAGAIAKLKALVEAYPGTSAARSAQRRIVELSVVGVRLSEPAVTWYQGGASPTVGAVIVVAFEEWCPHCGREVPKLAERYAELRARGYEVIGYTRVTRTSTDDGVRAFLGEHHVGFPVAREDGSVSTALSITGIPAAAVLVDGVVVWRGHPAQLTDETLRAATGR